MLKLSLTFSLFFIVILASAQLKGTYVYSAGVDGGSKVLTFTGKNFTVKQFGHVTNMFGEGSFKMLNNNLYLSYHHIIDKDSSIYKIDAKPSFSKYTKIFVKVFDDKQTMNGCSVSLRDNDFNVILYTTTLSDGAASLSISKVKNIHYLTIDFIGYNRVTIPYTQLIDKENDIYVNFKPQNTIIEPARLDVFRVIEHAENKLYLRNSSGEEFLYKKSK